MGGADLAAADFWLFLADGQQPAGGALCMDGGGVSRSFRFSSPTRFVECTWRSSVSCNVVGWSLVISAGCAAFLRCGRSDRDWCSLGDAVVFLDGKTRTLLAGCDDDLMAKMVA